MQKPENIAVPADIKRINRQKILQVLRSGESITVATIHEQTGISRPTVTRALQHYCKRGVLKSQGLGNTTSVGGKKPELFVFDDPRKILCVNLWPETLTLTLCGLVGDVYAVRQYERPLSNDLEQALRTVGEAADDFFLEQGVTRDDLYGVALSVPGTVDYDAQLLRYNSHAPGWGADVPMAERLKTLFGSTLMYFVDNAGKAAGRALLLDHPEYAGRRLLTLFTTWGVSSCMIERGHVLNGRDSLIGEVGHMLISDTGPVLCGCGKRGCLESLVSLEHVRALLAESGAPAQEGPFTFTQLFAASAAGDEHARKVVRYLAHCFAVALHNLSLAYNQEIVVFQGDFAWADETFDRCLKQELAEFRYYPGGEPFAVAYDQRDLSLLAARSCADRLKEKYFSSLD